MKNNRHPIFKQRLSFSQRASDAIARVGGSRGFIFTFFAFLVVWFIINSFFIFFGKFDPYPFILLNLVLSCLAAVQAPIILMSQNRQAERDRIDARYDYKVNRKAEREIQEMQLELIEIKKLLKTVNKKL